MPLRNLPNAIAVPALFALACCVLSACAPTQAPQPSPSESVEQGASLYASSAIGVGTEVGLIDVPVDDEITTWLNTTDHSGESLPPVPSPDAWHWFTMPSAEASVVFDTGIETSFDVLEILTYPDGLDDEGVPISVEVHPLCGPQADVPCRDVAWGSSGVQIPLDVVEATIADTEYYAIGGIMLPIGDSHPDSFMALLRNERARS